MLAFFVNTGKQFWVYNGVSFVENSPRPLSDYGLPDYVSDLDAVQNWDRNSEYYIIILMLSEF